MFAALERKCTGIVRFESGWNTTERPIAYDFGINMAFHTRADLDRLVLAAIIPERARNAAGPAGDVGPATETMTAEWEHLKSQWSTPP